MESKLDLLIKLQHVDQLAASLEGKKSRIPEEIEFVKGGLKKAEVALKQAESKYTEYQKSLKMKEGEIEDEREKSKKSRLRQNDVKTNEEYRALLKEIDHINSRIDLLENELIKMFDLADFHKQEIAKSKQELESAKKICQEKTALKEKELVEIESEIEFNREERGNLEASIDSELYKIYKKLLVYKDNAAVSKIGRKGNCQYCSVVIPPQTLNEVIADEKILFCPNCQRILYYREEE